MEYGSGHVELEPEHSWWDGPTSIRATVTPASTPANFGQFFSFVWASVPVLPPPILCGKENNPEHTFCV